MILTVEYDSCGDWEGSDPVNRFNHTGWVAVVTPIRHIAITNCPFRVAFSHLPKCGQLLRQKGRKNFT